MFAIFSGMSVLGFSVAALTVFAAPPDQGCPGCKGPLKDFEEIRRSFTEVLAKPTKCNPLSDRATPAACEFKQLCENFAVNRNSANLYENKKGEIIPNYALFSAEALAEECYLRKLATTDPNASKA